MAIEEIKQRIETLREEVRQNAYLYYVLDRPELEDGVQRSAVGNRDQLSAGNSLRRFYANKIFVP